MSDVKFCFGQISEGPGELCHCVDGKPHHHYVSSVWDGARWVLLSSEEGKSIIDALIADPDNLEETAKILDSERHQARQEAAILLAGRCLESG